MNTQRERHIAYRCPECGVANLGLVGKFAISAGMTRLKCECENAEPLEVGVTGDDKIRLSVPCLFCKQSHNYVITKGMYLERESFTLNCPYAGVDIAFVGGKESIDREVERTQSEILTIMTGFGAQELADIQPMDMNDDEILPDPAVYDTIRFIVKDLEAEGRVDCPCHEGEYDLRFIDDGIQVYCTKCGATYDFTATGPSSAESYLELDEIKLG